MKDITTLLGCATDDPRLEELVDELAEIPDLDEDEDRKTLTFASHGVLLTFNRSNRLSAIFLQPGESAEGTALPHDLSFSMSREDVRRHLGEPSLSKPTTTGLLGLQGWDRYDNLIYSLHIQYRPDEAGIAVITVLPPQVARLTPVS